MYSTNTQGSQEASDWWLVRQEAFPSVRAFIISVDLKFYETSALPKRNLVY